MVVLLRLGGRVRSVAVLLGEGSAYQAESQTTFQFVHHRGSDERTTLRALQVRDIFFAAALIPQGSQCDGREDPVEVHPEQRSGAILLVQGDVAVAGATEDVEEVGIASASFRAPVLLGCMFFGVFLGHVSSVMM
ncbi:MAG TPA: hypothetical protein DEP92_03740 [Candidatus Komeilibacteria bacterium]|nr:hypothetical protein [Candidatus Komeilibacteria bacterium]HCC73891.1 hypothetical protein [Candidatus Komeilibacteria bacterium]